MLRHALAIPHQQIGLFYSARTPDEFAYEDELRALARRDASSCARRSRGRSTMRGVGREGESAAPSSQPLVHDPATLCFICGPPALVAEMSALLEELGIARGRIRVEEWG